MVFASRPEAENGLASPNTTPKRLDPFGRFDCFLERIKCHSPPSPFPCASHFLLTETTKSSRESSRQSELLCNATRLKLGV